MDMYSNSSGASELLARQPFGGSWARSLAITSLALALGTPVRSQEPPRLAQSVAEAARNVREQKSNSTKHPKVITNDDLPEQSLAPSASAPPPSSSSANVAAAPKPTEGDCDNPDAASLKTDLQAAQAEQDQLRREITNKLTVISNSGVDMKNFKAGSSGVDMGALPLIETKPPIPERVTEVTLEEKVASLKRALRIACGPPEDGAIQARLDQTEQELNILQRQLVVGQDAYYSKPDYAQDTASKARIDAELQQSQDLQSEIDRLKAELAASQANKTPK